MAVSNAPPRVSLANVTASLAEDADATVRRKVADIIVLDDGVGAQSLALAGPAADRFEVIGRELFLLPCAVLDFESLRQLDVTVAIDDPTVGGAPDDSVGLSLMIADVNEPPSVAFVKTALTTLAENVDTSVRRKGRRHLDYRRCTGKPDADVDGGRRRRL